VDPTQTNAIASGIIDLYTSWEKGIKWSGFNNSMIEQYNRKNLTNQLAGYLNEICQDKS